MINTKPTRSSPCAAPAKQCEPEGSKAQKSHAQAAQQARRSAEIQAIIERLETGKALCVEEQCFVQ